MAKVLKKFNVIEFWNGKIKSHDVLPYFRNSWKEKYNKKDKEEILQAKQPSKRREKFKKWVMGRSSYMYWGRCEWECLVGSWPYGSKKLKDDMQVFMSEPKDLDDMRTNIDFYNIITQNMQKLDVHEQIMMNIDHIVDILYVEFKIDKEYDKRKVAKESSGNA